MTAAYPVYTAYEQQRTETIQHNKFWWHTQKHTFCIFNGLQTGLGFLLKLIGVPSLPVRLSTVSRTVRWQLALIAVTAEDTSPLLCRNSLAQVPPCWLCGSAQRMLRSNLYLRSCCSYDSMRLLLAGDYAYVCACKPLQTAVVCFV